MSVTTHTSGSDGELFKRELFWNSEVCSHCFNQIRTVETARIRVGKNREKTVDYQFRYRTDGGLVGYDDNNTRQTHCRECGGDGSADTEDMSKLEMMAAVENMADYLTAVRGRDVDLDAMRATVGKLKSQQDNQGGDTEILIAAFNAGVSL